MSTQFTNKIIVEDGIEYTVETNGYGSVWRLNGVLHRVNGPAVEWKNGNLSWYRNGKLHSEDGPAIAIASGAEFYYINGELLTKEEHKIEMRKRKLSTIS